MSSEQDLMTFCWCTGVCSYRDAGRRLISLIALALNLDEDFFVKDGPLDPFLRLLHYPGLLVSDE